MTVEDAGLQAYEGPGLEIIHKIIDDMFVHAAKDGTLCNEDIEVPRDVRIIRRFHSEEINESNN